MDRIRELRKQRGLSQAELGKILNIAQNTLSAYERGSRDPDTETLSMIAKYFGVSTDYLLGNDNAQSNKPEHTPTDDDIKVALFGGDGEVTDEMWDEVKRFAEFVKSKQKKGEK